MYIVYPSQLYIMGHIWNVGSKRVASGKLYRWTRSFIYEEAVIQIKLILGFLKGNIWLFSETIILETDEAGLES